MLVEAEIWTVARTDQGNAVLIKPIGSETAVPIIIGQLEAQSILIGLGNVPMPRPLTHDLILSVLSQFKVNLERIEITALKDETYFAQLVLRLKGTRIVIDARPSDSIALAVRQHCPIFIAEDVVEEAGIPISTISDQDKSIINPKEKEHQELNAKLEKMIELENYEEAAKIRDRLKEIEEE
jgi:bifunctional DNase/RNase